MSSQNSRQDFFVAGGTLWQEASSYIKRPADDRLLKQTMQGEYCNVLAARQMGKSSLMVRTAKRLAEKDVKTAIVDMSLLGSEIPDSQEWYFGFIDEISRQLRLNFDIERWWEIHANLGVVQRFYNFIRDVILVQLKSQIVIFVDEIDATLGLSFTDDFFATLRAFYNARSADPAFERISFVLIGVARPADLIKDQTRTPYNIGTHIDLSDFVFEDLESFQRVLDSVYPKQGADILKWVLEWTGGQPYLTQKLCAALMDQINHADTLIEKKLSRANLDNLVQTLFLGEEARTESNLRYIRDRILASPHKIQMLQKYQRIFRERKVMDEERSPAINELKLTGLVLPDGSGQLKVRNQIYRQVFDQSWIRENLPLSRPKVLAGIMTVLAILALLVTAYTIYRQSTKTAQTFMDQFESSSSADVRLTSLARLLAMDEGSQTQAIDLFWSLQNDEQIALFSQVSDPNNLIVELETVIEAVYQDVPNNRNGTVLLESISQVMDEIDSTDMDALRSEIHHWVLGRHANHDSDMDTAAAHLNAAWVGSIARGNPNLNVLWELASARAKTGSYDLALSDLEKLLVLDNGYAAQVVELFDTMPEFGFYWDNHKGQYPDLTSVISGIANIPTLTPSPELITLTSTPTTELSPMPSSSTPSSTPTQAPDFDLAFVSDQDGEYGVYIMDSQRVDQWRMLPRPADYERAWWPTFCGVYIAFEAQDMNGLKPQWIYFTDEEFPEALEFHSSLPGLAKMGVPRCSPDASFIAYSAYIPDEFDGWQIVINESAVKKDFLLSDNPSFGYVTWSNRTNFFLSMTTIDDDFYILQTTDFQNEMALITPAKGKYPALSPNGNQFVYLCANQTYLCLQALDDESVKLLQPVKSIKVGGEDVPVTAMWSGDGQWIYFSSAFDGDWDIYRIRPNGSDLQNMTQEWDTNEIMPALNWGD